MNNFEQTLSKAMRFCSTKEVCVFDIKTKLKNWGVDNSVSQKIISNLIEEKFIDEQRYANAFANDKFHFNNWGKIKIKYELRAKRIEIDSINIALENIADEEYSNKIKSLIENKLKTTKESDFQKLKAKIFRHLASKGFEPEIFSKLLNPKLEEHLKEK
ncbi:MAG: RecX family transcriptional regulator [Bacteroidales bacterium]|nr:RecX family transcriptional regulator [Bacteroidales bacterium]